MLILSAYKFLLAAAENYLLLTFLKHSKKYGILQQSKKRAAQVQPMKLKGCAEFNNWKMKKTT